MVETTVQVGDCEQSWPPEVGIIISALEAGGGAEERREVGRVAYHATSTLRLFTDGAEQQRILYTRDINVRSMGFITRHRLSLGYGGTVQMTAPTGATLSVTCTLLRCRQVAPGWYEGALYFNRDQTEFAEL